MISFAWHLTVYLLSLIPEGVLFRPRDGDIIIIIIVIIIITIISGDPSRPPLESKSLGEKHHHA